MQTIKVQIRFLSVLAEFCGEKEVTLNFPEGATLEDLNRKLVQKYPRLGDYIKDGRHLRTLRIMRNERPVEESGGVKAILKDGDLLTMFLTIAGG